MIVTNRFTFLHLHKSGGTFVNEWLMRFFADARPVGYHLPRPLIPAAFADLPALGLVRNPWSYYVSWYAFQSGQERPNALFRILSDDRSLGFEGTIRNMLLLGTENTQLDPLIAALPPAYGNRGLNLPGPALQAIRDRELGFYSFLYRYMYGEDGQVGIARMEQMREELPSLIRATGGRMDEVTTSYLAEAPATNTSDHAPYMEYYSAELRDLVGVRDAEVIARHGYQFGS